jgi:hypothetical protein
VTSPARDSSPVSSVPSPEAPELSADAIVSRLKTAAGVIAPTTVVSALLFWFGYVATLAQYQYFGVRLDLVNLSTPELLLSGVEALYVPLVAAFVGGLVIVAVHTSVTWVRSSPARDAVSAWIAVLFGVVGLLLLVRAVLGIIVEEVTRREMPGLTPLTLAAGPLCIGYGVWLLRFVARRRARVRVQTPWFDSPAMKIWARVGAFCIGGLLVAGLFWAVGTFAGGYGSGRGGLRAEGLVREPEVILDTTERLTDLPRVVADTEQVLGKAGGTYRYRYRSLRLLTESDGRLFLVPAPWPGNEGRTLVLPYDERVRLRLVPPPS